MESLRKAAAKRVVPMVGFGRQKQYLVHQDDLCAVVHEILEADWHVEKPVTAAYSQAFEFREIITSLSKRRRLFVPVPPRMILHGLQCAEALGIRSRLGSDSLMSLLHPSKNVDFTPIAGSKANYRPFRSPS